MVAIGLAQAPTGLITGTVTDESGAVVPAAKITVSNKETALVRTLTSGSDGSYSVASLPAGEYEVRAEATGFHILLRKAEVQTGNETKVDLRMQVGATKDVVTVEEATSQISYESHTIDGVITRQKIQELPLNGRSFLQLAFLEPGVTVSPGTTSQYNALFSVSILGGDSNKTAITVDGGNVRNSIEGQTGINFSQEVIQEFQLSSANFDLSTGITSVGAVNIVTRGGTNDLHGSAYFFFRDHNMSAYPGLKRNALSPDPFFARRNPGFWFGGPIKKDRLFFFFNYEYMNQRQVFTVQPDLPSIQALAGNYGSPYRGKQLSARFDYNLSAKHNLFARYSHDGNQGYGPNSGAPLPSNWVRNRNWSDQTVFGMTSTLKPTLVNDFRFNYTYWQNRNLFPTNEECPNCLGLNLPQITLVGSSNFAVGNTSNATQGRDLRRFTFVDSLTWQKGSHRLRFGTELERAPGTGFWGYCDPACSTLFSPEYLRSVLPAPVYGAYFGGVPNVISSNADLMKLPIAGAVVGVGDPSQPPPYNVGQAKLNNRTRFYAQDTWRMKPNFTLNYGLSWQFESTLVNRDLDKPAYLRPLYGNDLSPTNNNYHNFSPSLGFAWNLGKDSKTVVRGGFGIYYDTELLWRRLQERAFTGPVGNGRIQFPSSGFVNTIPGIINFSTGGTLVPVGANLPYGQLTTMTLGQFLQIYNQQIGAINQALAPKNLSDLSVRNIEINKSGAQLYPKDYPVQRGLHFNLGVQRQLRSDMVLTVDFARRVYLNTLLGELDYNRYNRFIGGRQSPVIPQCQGAAGSDPKAQCSKGGISFWTPGGRQVYNAMLVKLDKRFSRRFQFTASYALTDQHGNNGIANLDQWNSTWGPQGARHILNVSGIVELPWGFQLGIISASSSRGPLMASVSGVDLDGDGTTTEPIQGIPFNSLNRGSGKDDLARAVAAWTQKYPAGSKDARGQDIPRLPTLPANYDLGDNFSSQDIRLTKAFTWHERYKLSVFTEMFNVFNVANLGGYNFTLNSSAFGQPTQRAGQVFGSGGPRALQVGARFQF
ncbi:MAG: TonB-dependent receptor [Acidobacteria bacterium]|nr:TonB-dependent receptor [Acidobacteriota bacterium]MBI3471235.1 TonB-dependent receptor [Candidatus Solibacter usitatus]